MVGILLRARAATWNDLAIAVFAGRHAIVGGEPEVRQTAAGLDRAGHGNRRHESAREPRDQERQVNEKVMWRHGVASLDAYGGFNAGSAVSAEVSTSTLDCATWTFRCRFGDSPRVVATQRTGAGRTRVRELVAEAKRTDIERDFYDVERHHGHGC